MATNIKRNTGSGTTQTLTTTGASTANGVANSAGTNLDNRTELAITYSFELNCGFGTSVSAAQPIDLYLVPSLDGTNAADQASGTPAFQPDHYVGTFITASTGTTTRRLTIQSAAVGQYLYTAYIYNRTGVTVSANWTLKAIPENFQNA